MMALYKIVEHDGGWAYKLGDVFSETFASHDDARAAAEQVAEQQQIGGEPVDIAYHDASGEWRQEHLDGGERPETEVVDDPLAQTTQLP